MAYPSFGVNYCLHHLLAAQEEKKDTEDTELSEQTNPITGTFYDDLS